MHIFFNYRKLTSTVPSLHQKDTTWAMHLSKERCVFAFDYACLSFTINSFKYLRLHIILFVINMIITIWIWQSLNLRVPFFLDGLPSHINSSRLKLKKKTKEGISTCIVWYIYKLYFRITVCDSSTINLCKLQSLWCNRYNIALA